MVQWFRRRRLRRIIHEELVVWFDADPAGPMDRYAAVAEEAWRTLR